MLQKLLVNNFLTKVFCHFGPFLPFEPPNNPKNQNFEKNKKKKKKMLGNIIISHLPTTNDILHLSTHHFTCVYQKF